MQTSHQSRHRNPEQSILGVAQTVITLDPDGFQNFSPRTEKNEQMSLSKNNLLLTTDRPIEIPKTHEFGKPENLL